VVRRLNALDALDSAQNGMQKEAYGVRTRPVHLYIIAPTSFASAVALRMM
jgi:hypothetical protein